MRSPLVPDASLVAARQSGVEEQQQPAASERRPTKQRRVTAARTWVYEGASQQEEAVLQRVFSKMRTKYGDVYADQAQTRRKFDCSLDAFKGGHKRNLEAINSHPGVEVGGLPPGACSRAP